MSPPCSSRWSRRALGGLALLLALSLPSCRRGPLSRIPHPILLVHGFGGSGVVWEKNYGVVPYFESLGLQFGGTLRVAPNGKVSRDRSGGGRDFFAVSFRDPYSSISDQGAELAFAVAEVRRLSRAKEIVLVGFSMGGLTSRQYLVTHPGDHHVRHLVTIGTPHLGSPLANGYDLAKWLEEHRVATGTDFGGLIRASLADAGRKAFSQFEGTVRELANDPRLAFDLPAVRDLRPPRSASYSTYAEGLLPGETFLQELNGKTHPTDVTYACIVGEIRADDAAGKISAALQDHERMKDSGTVLKQLPPLFGNLAITLSGSGGMKSNPFDGGDGVVSVESQDLRNTDFFRSRRGLVKVVQVQGVHHLQECWSHDAIRNAVGAERLTLSEAFSLDKALP